MSNIYSLNVEYMVESPESAKEFLEQSDWSEELTVQFTCLSLYPGNPNPFVYTCP